MGTATMRFKEGLFVQGDSVHGNANQLVVSGSISVMGAAATETTYDSLPTTSETLDRNTWYYIPGNTTDDTDTDYQPRVWVDQGSTQSGIPIDTGGNWTDEIFTFFGGTTRMLSLKTAVEGTVTVSFKLIEGGGGSVAQNIPHAIPKANYDGISYASIGGINGGADWLGASSDPYSPIQVMYATDGYTSSSTWTSVGSDYHGHPSPHSNNASANIVRTEFTSFSVTINSVSGPFYVAIRQDSSHGNYNWWALADLQVTVEEDTSGYINFEGSSWSEGSDGIGFRNNNGYMEYKDEGESWKQFNSLAVGPTAPDRSVQFNKDGELGSGNFFYGDNANVGIGDFTNQSGEPDKLLHIRGNAGGSGNEAVLRFEDTTHVPTIESYVASGSLGSESALSAGDVVFKIDSYGADDNVGMANGFGYRQWSQIKTIVADNTSASDNEGRIQFGVSDKGEIEPVMDLHKWGILIRDQYINETGAALRLLESPYAYINFTNVERSGTPTLGESGFGLAMRQGIMSYKNATESDWTTFGELAGVSDADSDTYIDPEQSTDDDTLRFYANGSEEMRIASTGVQVLDKLGIGTTPSTLPFELSTATGPTVAKFSNTNVAGPEIMLHRDSQSSNQNDVDWGEQIGAIQWTAGGDTWTQHTAQILVEASQDWNSAGSDYGSYMVFKTTKLQASSQTQRMIINDNVQVVDDLYVDSDLYVSGSQEIVGSIECSSTIRSGTNYTNAIISNNQMGVTNARYLLSYTETGEDRVTVNANSQDLDFEVKDDGGNSIIYVDAADYRVNLGCPDGQPFAGALDDHMSAATTGVYIEGASSESVCTIANTTRDDSHTEADVLALVGGNGTEVSSTYRSGFFFDNVSTYYSGFPDNNTKFVSCWYKQHPTGSDRDASLPSSIQYCGGIMGDDAGGIDIDYSFTGHHDVCSDQSIEVGMIVESTGNLWVNKGMNTSLPFVVSSSSEKSKTVFGVVSKKEITSGRRLFVGSSNPLVVNSIGEGKLWVTNLVGEPTNGDYITSSPITGYGQLQDDDILHSYTVAKLTESIDWSSITETIEHGGVTYKKYLAGCTYHCG